MILLFYVQQTPFWLTVSWLLVAVGTSNSPQNFFIPYICKLYLHKINVNKFSLLLSYILLK